ncbi:hypothetical protein Cch01nite_16170 [Cellulomonas chitinilytica]|uniref:LppM domain-containing protein n=1 Tax=Cellulomonas chitinilytica TaxID=398759 RepID=A0A919P2W4_9CELL|nr:hypothetical protein [Cellulomonas chitinilytica]GIG20893.1 hypothetical protein Cch01nite_16170 [Cellulomonas chitinilytica]
MLRASAPTRRLLVGATTAVVALLALSGCYRIEMAVTIQDDDTVDGTAIIAIDKSVLGLTGGTIDDVIPDDTLSGEGTVEPFTDGDLVGKKFTFENTPISTFSKEQSDDADELTIEHVGDTYVVDGTLDMTSGDETDDAGAPALTGGTVKFTFTFPGEVVEANGEIDSETHSVTWAPTDLSTPVVMHAVGKDKAGWALAPWMLFGGGGLGLLVVLGVVLLVVLRSRRSAEAVVGPVFSYYPGTAAPVAGAYPPPAQAAPPTVTSWGPPQH